METYDPSTLLDEIRGLREEVHQVVDFIKELKREYSVPEEKVELNSSDVMRLLGISKASLARRRDASAVPYRYVSCNRILYPFKGLYIAVKSGRVTFKGLRRIGALQRLNAYKDDILKGYLGEDIQDLFEEL